MFIKTKREVFVAITLTLLFLFVVTAAVFTTITKTDFDAGFYNATFYNTSLGGIQLNYSGQGVAAGNYTSKIFDAGATATWNSLSFVSSAIGELANSMLNETNPPRFGSANLDMVGNVILYHFNNDTAAGENRTVVFNFAGTPNFNGTWASGAGNDGVSNGSTLKTLGQFAGYFDGNGDAVNVSGIFDPTNNGTVMFWIQPKVDSTWRRILGFADDWEIVINPSNVLSNQLFVKEVVSNPTWSLASNTWYHVAMTWDFPNGNTKTYVNGKLNFTGSASSSDPGTGMLTIGTRTNTIHFYRGLLDELAIFNRTLTDDEIRSAYVRGITLLNLSVRSCNDAACDIETFTNLANFSLLQQLSLSNNRFFQYRLFLNTSDNSSDRGATSTVYNVTLDYTLTSLDLALASSNITFSTTTPVEGQTITINATISNTGSSQATNVKVQFLDDDQEIGNTTITIPADSSRNTTINWKNQIGKNNLTVKVDPDNSVDESNETNNNASTIFNVNAYHVFYGSVSGKNVLGSSRETVLKDYGGRPKNFFAVDRQSSFDFYSLEALGIKTNLLPASKDFAEADTILGMSNYTDSLNLSYSLDGSSPKERRTYRIGGRVVANVPVVNSTNSTSTFVTGLLWDKNDDTNGEYDQTEKEDLVFFTKVNSSQQGLYGVYDYEIKIAAPLRNYGGGGNEIIFYLEME